ncbi:hypothetical protein ACGFZH_40015 [Streptomyces zaomyceticus]
MEYEAVPAQLTATQELPGLGSVLGRLDSVLVSPYRAAARR